MSKKLVQNQNNICKNCETKFVGNFCPNCGQSTKDYDKPFSFIIYDLAGNIIAFDTRLWRTLKSLLFKPGKIAHEFIIGHRVRYMPPFRFYIMVSFIFFLLLNITTSESIKKNEDSWFQYNPGNTDSLSVNNDSIIADSDELVIFPEFNFDDETGELIQSNDTLAINTKNSGNIGDTDIEDIKENPEIYFQTFLKYFSWSLFFLMPVYAFLLWLFFRRKYKNYIGHLIFAVNQHAFLFIILIIIIALNMIFKNASLDFLAYLMLLVPLYSTIGARKLYKRSWISSFLRLCTIFFFYFLFISTAVILLIYLTFDK